MDKYDKAIKYLTKHPDRIIDAWHVPLADDEGELAQAYCLFQYCNKTGRYGTSNIGCLTTIRSGNIYGTGPVAFSEILTQEIRADERIPVSPGRITVKDLPVFAEWQRRLDREIRDKKDQQ